MSGSSTAAQAPRAGRRILLLLATLGVSGSLLTSVAAQHPGMPQHPGMMPSPATPRPEPRPGEHGTPAGWTLTWPKGDAAKGREVFTKLECYACHEVKGEKFPAPTEQGKVGPELAMMGPLHAVDYFVEAVVNPSAVIDKGRGYEAPDGSSKMPSFNDSMTVQELVDLVAYLKALTPAAATAPPEGHGGH